MATAEYEVSQNVSLGFKAYVRGRLTYSGSVTSDTAYKISLTGEVRSGNAAGTSGRLEQWRVNTQVGHDPAGNREQEWTDKEDMLELTTWVGKTSASWSFTRYYGNSYTVSCWLNFWAAEGFESKWNPRVSITVPARPFGTPRPPKNVSVSQGINGKPVITWVADYDDYDEACPWSDIRIERSTDGGTWESVMQLSWYALSWTDLSAKYGHTYSYRIRTSNIGTNSAGTGTERKYSSYVETSSITVQSSLSIYDNAGAKTIGLVTSYDSSGKARKSKICVYDSSGKLYTIT